MILRSFVDTMISNKYPTMGNTKEGASWCLKALHPATKIDNVLRGIPDADSYPCVIMEYEQVINLGSPAAGDWFAEIYAIPHPVHPLSVATHSGAVTAYGGLINATLSSGATGYSEYSARFAQLCHSYRMLYHSMTIDLDASALSNKGTIVAAQFPMARDVLNISIPNPALPTYQVPIHVVRTNWANNFPGSKISQLPGSYSGLAQDGCYMPLKLDPSSPWVNSHNMHYVLRADQTVALSDTDVNFYNAANLPNASTAGQTFPFFGGVATAPASVPCTDLWYKVADSQMYGDATIPLQQFNVGLASAYNLDVNARLTVTVRWGVEMRVHPTSVLAPSMQPSCMVDDLAMKAYSDMAATLPWAYPSSYNAENKLATFLKQAWTVVKPALGVLSVLPHPAAQVIGRVANALPNFERPSGSATVRSARAPATPRSSARQKQQRSRTPRGRRTTKRRASQ